MLRRRLLSPPLDFGAVGRAVGNLSVRDRRTATTHRAAGHIGLRWTGRTATAEEAEHDETDPYGDGKKKPMAVHASPLGSTIVQPAIERGWMRVRCRPELAS